MEEMAAAVDAFRNEAIAAVESLDMEIRRALEWIHHDRHDHWNHQVRRGWERITEARVQLQQAMTARRIGDHDPACIDEKKALARAKRRLEIAQEKVEAVRHCARAIDRAVDEYRGARTPLSSWLESEAPKALAALRRMMDNLEDYLALQAPGGERERASQASTEARSAKSQAKSDAQGAEERSRARAAGIRRYDAVTAAATARLPRRRAMRALGPDGGSGQARIGFEDAANQDGRHRRGLERRSLRPLPGNLPGADRTADEDDDRRHPPPVRGAEHGRTAVSR